MNKIYFLCAVCAVVCGAYFYGANVADAKCRMQITAVNLQSFQNLQNQIIENKRKNHEIVYKTSLRDIRRILHDEYTIAE